MAKPTSLAAQVSKQSKEKLLAEAKEDAKLARAETPLGKVRVRLVRPFYDAEGRYHPAGPALLDEGNVPSSAKVLRKAEVAEATPEAEESTED